MPKRERQETTKTENSKDNIWSLRETKDDGAKAVSVDTVASRSDQGTVSENNNPNTTSNTTTSNTTNTVSLPSLDNNEPRVPLHLAFLGPAPMTREAAAKKPKYDFVVDVLEGFKF